MEVPLYFEHELSTTPTTLRPPADVGIIVTGRALHASRSLCYPIIPFSQFSVFLAFPVATTIRSELMAYRCNRKMGQNVCRFFRCVDNNYAPSTLWRLRGSVRKVLERRRRGVNTIVSKPIAAPECLPDAEHWRWIGQSHFGHQAVTVHFYGTSHTSRNSHREQRHDKTHGSLQFTVTSDRRISWRKIKAFLFISDEQTAAKN